jgi:predicted acylesterase/phospholipase RssA
LPPQNLLAVSGGGENGAFGAGLLCGWSAAGTRPRFSLVTGVSTGALTAPFAFLGADYDPQLRSVYTNITLSDVVQTRGYLAAVFDDAMADTLPLFRTISRYLDAPMLSAIARGHDEGRLLLIGTTDIDAQVPVTWNIGAIAKSGHPQALDSVRRILLASAAIPGAFPPVMVDVEVEGRRYQEMHVDGGAVNQAFLYPAALTSARRERLHRGEPVLPARAFVIRNARLDPDWAAVERRTMSITARAIGTMIAVSGYSDMLRLWVNAERDSMDFNLAYIDSGFTREAIAPFEQAYMRALFDHGFEQARKGFRWAKVPPGLDGSASPDGSRS